MTTESAKPQNILKPEASLEELLPGAIAILKQRWADYLFALPPNQVGPNLGDWLSLLQIAVKKPEQIGRYLDKLLDVSPPPSASHNDWLILTELFDLTFNSCQNQHNRMAWQNLVKIQNRILKVAANRSRDKQIRTPPPQDMFHVGFEAIEALNDILTNSLDLNQFIEQFAMVLQQKFNFPYINLYLLNLAKQTLTLDYAYWRDKTPQAEDYVSVKVGQQTVGHVAATGQSRFLKNISQPEPPLLPNITARVVVPLLAGKNLIGVLDVQSDEVNQLTRQTQQSLEVIANYAAHVIKNRHLQAEIKRREREQQVFQNANSELEIELETATVIERMSHVFTEYMEVGACVITQIDTNLQQITASGSYIIRYPGNPRYSWRRLNEQLHLSRDPITRQILKTKRPLIQWAETEGSNKKQTEKTALNTIWQTPYTGNKQLKWGVMLVLPMLVSDRVIGAVELYDKNPNRRFSASDIQSGLFLARHTSLAIERAYLLEETYQRLSEISLLYAMAQRISDNFDLQAILDGIAAYMRQVLACRGCAIYLYNTETKSLQIKAADGLNPNWRTRLPDLRLGEGPVGRAAAQNRTIYIPDTQQVANFDFIDREVRSLVVCPLTTRGQLIGTINMDHEQPNAFTTTQQHTLTIAANQISVAIENTRLFVQISNEQQRTQAIIQHMADGVLLIDAEGVIVTCNDPLEEMIGLQTNDIVGRNINAETLPPNLSAITATTTKQARTNVLYREVTIEKPRPRALQIFSTTVFNEESLPSGEVRLIHDVTKERELEDLRNDFLSTIYHEIRTPIGSMHGAIEVLLDEELDRKTRHKYLTDIKTQTKELYEIVSNFLDLSKFDAGKLELRKDPLSVNEIITHTLIKLQGLARQQQVELTADISIELPLILGDAKRLSQVMNNLVSNALKFTPANGTVTIRAKTTAEQEILVAVADTGVGIPEEMQEQIFSRYYQGEAQGHSKTITLRGSGLGLHIARKIIEQHGGKIWVESTVDEGSTFKFTLPILVD